jgi:hypothetical protein
MRRVNCALPALVVLCGLILSISLVAYQSGTSAPQTTSTPTTKWVTPVRGQAEIQILKPKTVVKGKDVTTTIEVKNVSSGAIAGLQVEEYWWDKANNPVPGGDRQRLKQPLLQGQTATFTLLVQKDSRMFRNNYQFSHTNGTIKATSVPKF